METKYLRSFVAVADCCSFSKAENQLFLSKQGLKRQIDVLEQELDAILFKRTQRGLFLTSAGELLYDYAKSAIKAEDNMLERLNDHEKRLNSITILNHPNQRTWLEKVFGEFSQKYPKIVFQVKYIIPSQGAKQKFIEQIYEQVINNTVDMALHVMYEGDMIPDDLEYLKVIDQKAYCLLMPNHPLARESCVSIEQASQYHVGFTQRRPDSNFANYLKENCPNHTVYKVNFNNTPEIFSVCYNSGIWITKAFYAEYMPPLIAVPLDLECNSYSGLLYRKKHSVATEKFLRVVKELERSNCIE